MASFVAEATNIYSNSIDEKAIVACFLLCHDVVPPPNKKTYLEVDL